nr:Uvs007 [uncultured bacterium]
MSDATPNSYTPEDVTQAFNEISATLFADKLAEATPKLLITAGLQSSGKTYLLEKSLLPSGRYANYVRLYLPEYRQKHPQYAEMEKHGVLHTYEHTEAFVREVSGKIFTQAFKQKYNIIMECAFDSLDFAGFMPMAQAAGYQFDVHIVACNQVFAHVSSIKRALKSLKNGELERFVQSSELESSRNNAQVIIEALESAAKTTKGSKITLYERGFGKLKERTLRAQSLYTEAPNGTPNTSTTTAFFSYGAYEKIISHQICTREERFDVVKECHLALLKTGVQASNVPDRIYNELYAYIITYMCR